MERVSEEVINQLLDDLSAKTLNDGEREAILERNVTRADKARALIDAIRKKGSNASARMIAYLQRRDHRLHAQLWLPFVISIPISEEAASFLDI